MGIRDTLRTLYLGGHSRAAAGGVAPQLPPAGALAIYFDSDSALPMLSAGGSAWRALAELGAGVALESQVSWFVDPANGSDQNRGNTALAPLRTLGEFFRRTRTDRPLLSTTVQLLSDVTSATEPVGDISNLVAYNDHYPSQVTIKGTRTVLRAGTITAKVDPNYAANPAVEPRITDSNLPGASWATSGPGGTTLVHKRIRIVGGPRDGAVAWLYEDMGAKQARVGPFWHAASFAVVLPDVNDAYEVYDTTRFLVRVDVRTSAFFLVFEDVAFVGGFNATTSSFQCNACDFPEPAAPFGSLTTMCAFSDFNACYFRNSELAHIGGNHNFRGCVFGRGPELDPSAWGVIGAACLGRFGLTAQSCELVARENSFWDLLAPYGVVAAGTTSVAQARNGGIVRARSGATLWANGTAGPNSQGVWLAPGGKFYWHPLTADVNTKCFFNAGYTRDFLIGETPKSIAELAAVGFAAANQAAAFPTKRHPGD